MTDEILEQIRERTDLVDWVGRTVTLRKAGQRFVGLCPFHSENSPSFTVHREKQFFHCFGCQAHGDLFAFCMRQEGLDLPEAVRALAREAGIELPEALA